MTCIFNVVAKRCSQLYEATSFVTLRRKAHITNQIKYYKWWQLYVFHTYLKHRVFARRPSCQMFHNALKRVGGGNTSTIFEPFEGPRAKV